MSSPQERARGLGDVLWFLGWITLLVGVLLALVGRWSGPSPGSEWPVFEIVGPLFAGAGALGVLLGGALRWRRRR